MTEHLKVTASTLIILKQILGSIFAHKFYHEQSPINLYICYNIICYILQLFMSFVILRTVYKKRPLFALYDRNSLTRIVNHFSEFWCKFYQTIFSNYTELLRLENILRIFWNYFWKILEINVFQSKNVKSAVIFFLNSGHR